MFAVNLHEFKPIQAMDCINLNMIINKYEVLPGLIGAQSAIMARGINRERHAFLVTTAG